MNSYLFNELYVGLNEQFSIKIDDEKQRMFMSICGDNNPMHIDDSFAIQNGYEGKIVYGMLTASLYSTLVGVYLPGKYCLFKKCDVEWPNAVYIGDELTVKGEIKEIDESFRTIRIYAEIRNQNNIKVSRAKLTVQFKGDF